MNQFLLNDRKEVIVYYRQDKDNLVEKQTYCVLTMAIARIWSSSLQRERVRETDIYIEREKEKEREGGEGGREKGNEWGRETRN